MAALPTCLCVSLFSLVRFGRVASTLSDGKRSSLLGAYSEGIRCCKPHNLTNFTHSKSTIPSPIMSTALLTTCFLHYIFITSCGAKAQQTRPRVVHRGIVRLLGIDKNVTRSSHDHSIPSLKISCKSVQPFSRNIANKERKKERKIHTNKEIDRK